MRLLDHYKNYVPEPGRPLILALGNFDGVHRGHQKLLGKVIEQAETVGGIAAALTFQSHPQHLLHPEAKPPLIISPEHKLVLLERLGIELVFWIPFTREFSQIEAALFVENVLVRSLGVKELYLGHDARFGRGRAGDASMVRTLSQKLGLDFEEISAVTPEDDTVPVSSTRIRELILNGHLEKIPSFLGRPFTLLGKVTPGNKRGTGLGYPTANIEVPFTLLPPEGVYPAKARALGISRQRRPDGEGEDFSVRETGPWHQGAFYFGRRPTFEQETAPAVPEIFLFDFSGDLYGKTLEVVLYPRLRPEMKFQDAESLKAQMEKDVAEIRQRLNREALRVPADYR